MKQLLESEGYDVVGDVADGASALSAAARLTPDVVLLDIQLPDLDGFEVAQRLAARGTVPAVILISGRDRTEYDRQIGASLAVGFLSKSDLSGAAIEWLLSGVP